MERAAKFVAFCCIQRREDELPNDVTELISWPPTEEETTLDEAELIARSEQDAQRALGWARLYLVAARDEKTRSSALAEYLKQLAIDPIDVAQLDADVEVDFEMPADVSDDSVAIGRLPTLFLLRDLTPETVGELHEYCLDILGKLTL